MIPRAKFKTMVDQKLIASVRVVPIPMESQWCIDAIIRMPMEAGSTTDTVSKPQSSGQGGDGLRRFKTIDDAAQFLKEIGIGTFTVDTQDSFTFSSSGADAVKYVEQSVQIWDDDASDEAVNSPVV
ncbi:hypothetical protein [Granulosicoccus antarcticus]|uniref:Uncharacterized protein n=1 Tax=Granulosicoccus antarcticus IMCC3135 TaxID=1192854 RepID=A0A2Z2NPC4_9GAMM|nr:hypothetical protein [Granulosicoccus antarcticus]ASJ71518.1 hypothetical protein IMCC3135_07060 [Granulosicoccus antarcticus IMCC3135]